MPRGRKRRATNEEARNIRFPHLRQARDRLDAHERALLVNRARLMRAQIEQSFLTSRPAGIGRIGAEEPIDAWRPGRAVAPWRMS